MTQLIGLGNDGNIIANQIINDGNTSARNIKDIMWAQFISLQFITRNIGGAFTGTWLVEGSNNWAPFASGGNFGQAANAGDWTDITNQFAPALTTAVSTATTQMVQSPANGAAWRAIRVTLTRTSGAGTSITADVWLSGKGG